MNNNLLTKEAFEFIAMADAKDTNAPEALSLEKLNSIRQMAKLTEHIYYEWNATTKSYDKLNPEDPDPPADLASSTYDGQLKSIPRPVVEVSPDVTN